MRKLALWRQIFKICRRPCNRWLDKYRRRFRGRCLLIVKTRKGRLDRFWRRLRNRRRWGRGFGYGLRVGDRRYKSRRGYQRRGSHGRDCTALKPAMLAIGTTYLTAIHTDGTIRNDITGAAGRANEQHCEP